MKSGRNIITIIKSITIISLCLLLQGCFFFFWIPGQAINAISDAASGKEGEHYVGDSATVGARIMLDTSKVGTIEKLEGFSSRCKQPAFPIRAKLRVDS